MRYCPSTRSASLDSACRLSRVCALAKFFLARLTLLDVLGLAGLRPGRSHDLLFVPVGVPDVQGAHLGELGHRPPVGGNRGHGDRRGVRLRESVVLRSDQEACGHPLDVVLEWAGQRLVEVVQIEQQPAFGRGERTEVRQVSVPAQLHRQTRPRRVLEVGGHDPRGTAVEGERRNHHPTVTHRDEVGLARLVLLLQQKRSGQGGRKRVSNPCGSTRGLHCSPLGRGRGARRLSRRRLSRWPQHHLLRV